jgi:hypothetical protein
LQSDTRHQTPGLNLRSGPKRTKLESGGVKPAFEPAVAAAMNINSKSPGLVPAGTEIGIVGVTVCPVFVKDWPTNVIHPVSDAAAFPTTNNVRRAINIIPAFFNFTSSFDIYRQIALALAVGAGISSAPLSQVNSTSATFGRVVTPST